MADHHPGAGGESLSKGSLTVLFEDPFWIGLFELADREGLRICKVTFGAEPSEREIMEFIDRNGHRLRYSQAVDTSTTLENRKNPKRQLREARRQTIPQGIGTKSQQALRQQQEQNKTVRLQRSKAEREAEQQRRFELSQAKKKEKHRGH